MYLPQSHILKYQWTYGAWVTKDRCHLTHVDRFEILLLWREINFQNIDHLHFIDHRYFLKSTTQKHLIYVGWSPLAIRSQRWEHSSDDLQCNAVYNLYRISSFFFSFLEHEWGEPITYVKGNKRVHRFLERNVSITNSYSLEMNCCWSSIPVLR